MLKGFKAFILRGNVVELAVAFIMGAAFGAVVKSVVDNVVTPIIGSIVGSQGFAGRTIHLRGENAIAYGQVIDDVLAFLLIAAAVYFLIVAPINALNARRAGTEPTTRPCPHCLSEIPLAATRCPHCTSEVEAAA
jgi:large conductance mechanosensitive channel